MYKALAFFIVFFSFAMEQPKVEITYHNHIVPRDVLNYMVPYFLFEKEEEMIEDVPNFKPSNEDEKALYPKRPIFFKDLNGRYKEIGVCFLERSGLFYYPFPDTKIILNHKSSSYELIFENAFKASAVACSLFLDLALAWKEMNIIKVALIPLKAIKKMGKESRVDIKSYIIHEMDEKELAGNLDVYPIYNVQAIAFNKKADQIILKSEVSLPSEKSSFKTEYDFIPVPEEYVLDEKRTILFADYARRSLVHPKFKSFYTVQMNNE